MQMYSITPPIVLVYILMKDSCSPRSGWTVNPPAVLKLVSSLSNELQRATSSVCRLCNSALSAYKALRVNMTCENLFKWRICTHTYTLSHKDAHFSVMHVQKLHRSQRMHFKDFIQMDWVGHFLSCSIFSCQQNYLYGWFFFKRHWYYKIFESFLAFSYTVSRSGHLIQWSLSQNIPLAYTCNLSFLSQNPLSQLCPGLFSQGCFKNLIFFPFLHFKTHLGTLMLEYF